MLRIKFKRGVTWKGISTFSPWQKNIFNNLFFSIQDLVSIFSFYWLIISPDCTDIVQFLDHQGRQTHSGLLAHLPDDRVRAKVPPLNTHTSTHYCISCSLVCPPHQILSSPGWGPNLFYVGVTTEQECSSCIWIELECWNMNILRQGQYLTYSCRACWVCNA